MTAALDYVRFAECGRRVLNRFAPRFDALLAVVGLAGVAYYICHKASVTLLGVNVKYAVLVTECRPALAPLTGKELNLGQVRPMALN